MNYIRSLSSTLSRFVRCTVICDGKEYLDELKTYFNTALSERVQVILEYVKQVSLISHDSIHTHIQTAENRINENIGKIQGTDTSTTERMEQLQDNMNNIVRTVNITETKIAGLTVSVEVLRKAISESIDDMRTHTSRQYHQHR